MSKVILETSQPYTMEVFFAKTVKRSPLKRVYRVVNTSLVLSLELRSWNKTTVVEYGTIKSLWTYIGKRKTTFYSPPG